MFTLYIYIVKGFSCRAIDPHFERYSDTYKKIKFIKVDVDKLEEISAMTELKKMPQFIVYCYYYNFYLTSLFLI
jgi:hypothetical protein